MLEKQENPQNFETHEVLASTIEEFTAHQDDPAWRMRIAEEWYENLIKIPAVVQKKTEEVRQEWEKKGENGLLAKIKRLEEEGGEMELKLANYTKIKLENLRKYRAKDGAIDFEAVAREEILGECRNLANNPEPNILIPFEDYRKWLENYARNESEGDEEEYESTINDMLDSESMAMDNPTFMLAPGKDTETFIDGFKEDMANGLVSGIKQPEYDKDKSKVDFKGKDKNGRNRYASLTIYREPMPWNNYEKIVFVCEPFSREDFEKTGNFNVHLNSVPTSSYTWTGTKPFMEYLRQNNISFELVDKGNNVYAYHLIKEK